MTTSSSFTADGEPPVTFSNSKRVCHLNSRRYSSRVKAESKRKMTQFATIKIDPSEKFETLPKAPIVEAVIELRCKPTVPLEANSLTSAVKAELPDYPKVDSQDEFEQGVKFEIGKPPQASQSTAWKGLRLQSEDQKHIVQFNKDGFVFSRLQPYENWEKFSKEAFRLIGIYQDIAKANEWTRVGLRFINRFSLAPQESEFEQFLHSPPSPPKDLNLPFLGFLHHEMFAVPGHRYGTNIIRTIQPPIDPLTAGPAIILDIDVFTVENTIIESDNLRNRLGEMRWLKNKIFFGSVTPKAIESFKQ
jgi:uncharacterized protein (TIGR04255 family)